MTSLQELPKKVDELTLQVSQLRAEVHGEFSAVRGEMATAFAAVRAEMATKADLAAIRGEIKEGDEDTRRQMRVLHEEVIARLALLQEGIAAAFAKKPPRRRR